MEYILENEVLRVTINSKGAELTSIYNKAEERECLWNGDPAAWGRHAPVLFPVVGKYKDCKSKFEGKTYEMGQHGFARDMEFILAKEGKTSIELAITENEDTLKKYPFKFRLICGYELSGNAVKVIWKVENTNDRKMYFSIGGHPAFVGRKKSLTGAEFEFDCADKLDYYLINGSGNMIREKHELALNGNRLEVSEHLFDKDALIVQDRQASAVSLYEDGKRLVTVRMDCPLFGLWSATGKGNPFVCIRSRKVTR